ncbi:hypothetical protein F5Y16DRAFT_119201 [Xylariaceae sp. FL0255]|nr:hypothetical protein F5Y16DRAFT_119201 [Xylariaceae sp. FL0255]
MPQKDCGNNMYRLPDMASEDEDTNDHQIYYMARVCEMLFTERLLARPQESERIKEEHQRFHRWAACLSVLSRSERSLDAHLRNASQIRDRFINMLQVLANNLNDYCHLRSSNSTTSKPTGSEVRDTLKGISFLLNILHHLGHDLQQRPAGLVLDHLRTRDGAKGFYSRMHLVIVKLLYPDVTASFAEQLAVSISIRRERLMSRIRRKSVKEARRERAREKKQDKQALAQTQQSVSDVVTQLNLLALGSETTPSSETVKPKATLESGSRTNNLPLYPQTPAWSAAEKYHTCQWCTCDIPYTQKKEHWEAVWRAHFEEDLKPYVCLAEQCGLEPMFFASRKEWREHMDRHSPEWTEDIHQTNLWYCDSRHHAIQYFKKSIDLSIHLEEEHKAEYEYEERFEIVNFNSILAPRGPTECPLCGEDGAIVPATVGKIQPPIETYNASQSTPTSSYTALEPPSDQKTHIQVPMEYFDSNDDNLDPTTAKTGDHQVTGQESLRLAIKPNRESLDCWLLLMVMTVTISLSLMARLNLRIRLRKALAATRLQMITMPR